jgi:iron(III) transport system ATP-binding protein
MAMNMTHMTQVAAGAASPAHPATQRRPYLVVNDVTKRFKNFLALKGVSLDVREGEFMCFLGPSGCGKTTLLRAIAGLDIQSSGTIHQGGRDISALPPEERDFGIVFQSYALFPNLTLRKNIAFGLENRGMASGQITARVEELLGLIGLTEHGDKYPSQISGGQQQRVALARALAPKPGLILLDEPLSALDAKVRIHLRNELKQLQARLGVTTIMVTHDQHEALSMADRIVVMNMGGIEQVGSPLEIYNNPATRFVADFVGAMNFFDGAVSRDGEVQVGGVRLAVAGATLAKGAPVTVAIRPEDIRVGEAPPEGDPNASNTLKMEVADAEFLGSEVRLSLNYFTSGPVVAQTSQQAVRALQIAPGQRIDVRLPPDRLRVFVNGAHRV